MRDKLGKAALVATIFFAWAAPALNAEPMHGIAMHGEPALPADFEHFPYANPDAPTSGDVRYGVRGTFDSLNPFLLKSIRTTARGIIDPEYGNLVFESLMQRSRDEPFTLYGLIAETVETDDERTWAEFAIHPEARWSDGVPITPEDVIFTFDILTEKGRPPYNTRMDRIDAIEKTAERKVKFTFNEKADREFVLLIGMMPILPKHAINAETFDQSPLAVPVGSGPYLVDRVEPGTRIIYRRDPDYWGRDLPSKRGFDNYESITVEYFRDQTALFEAFKKGIVDIYPEGDPVKWATAYDFPAVEEGKVKKSSFISARPESMYAFFFNTRREVFADRDVREALANLFDFEWANRNLFQGQYSRTASFWQNSEELSAIGRAADERERALLAPFPDAVLPDVMEGTYLPNETDGSGRDRRMLRRALKKLGDAGYAIQDGKLVKDGKQLAFEIMVSGLGEEKMALAYKRSAELLGIAVTVRSVDDAQFQKRRQTWDYDVSVGSLSSSLSPGAEQYFRWGSQSRDAEGTFNYSGASDPAIDAMIDAMVNAREREDFAAAVRALDRILISGHYVIPLYHIREKWVAHWEHIQYPEYTPLYGYELPVWWSTK
ncbi:extracellular solute-binding protein [Oricola cellulosilytica]|uniref:ABC transporter substrate-binding protein n=1 Tax=Oricola cellulosilytica TaxID=1429082 RepID=A0A4R0PDA0_9HYPH|nr:extracellular solute-binding protein [Oricola cellulosilytica]TCD13183.1 ABC transporter substrate-binding protein [Oricola cellulosilytica]